MPRRSPSPWVSHSMMDPLAYPHFLGFFGSFLVFRSLGSCASDGRPYRPVAIPRCEMRDRHAPESLADGVERGDLPALALRHAKVRQFRRCCGDAGSVEIEIREAGHRVNREDLHDQTVVAGHPQRLLAIVVAHGHGTADREVEEVLEVERQRGIERDVRGAGRDGFVGRQLHRIRVRARRRQIARHRLAPGDAVADGVSVARMFSVDCAGNTVPSGR